MTAVRVAMVDVYPIRGAGATLEVLALRRSHSGRCPGAWESVHGHLENGETPQVGALRELREETGLVPKRLYNLSRVDALFLQRENVVALIPVFAAFVDPAATVRLSDEHDEAAWLTPDDAAKRWVWPRMSRAIQDLEALVGAGDAGPLEDVLRVG